MSQAVSRGDITVSESTGTEHTNYDYDESVLKSLNSVDTQNRSQRENPSIVIHESNSDSTMFTSLLTPSYVGETAANDDDIIRADSPGASPPLTPRSLSAASIVLPSPDSISRTSDEPACTTKTTTRGFLKRSKSAASTKVKQSENMSDLKQVLETEKKLKKQKRLQSKSEKFHRLFSDITDDPVNSYHCALVQDMFVQGMLYVTPSYFCFHSKLMGKRTLIRISVSDVVSIFKAKTVGIIPNAVGVETKTEKYTFGSLMARESTYRLLMEVWQKSRGAPADAIPTSSGSSENDSCSLTSNEGETGSTNVANCSEVFSPHSVSFDSQLLSPSVKSPSSYSPPTSPDDVSSYMSSPADDADESPSAREGPSSTSLDQQRHVKDTSRRTSSQSVQMRPLCVLLLFVSVALVLVMTFSTIILTHKILRLQTVVEMRVPDYVSAFDARSTPELSQLCSTHHVMNIQQLQEVLDSHKQILEQVNRSLVGLTDLAHGVCSSVHSNEDKRSS